MVKLLIKNRLRSVLASMLRKKGGKSGGKGKIIGFLILYIYLIAYFIFMSVSAAIGLAEIFLVSGASWFYFGVFMLADVAILSFFSIFETKSELFECKDNDLLLSMPIKPQSIVVSRMSVVLIYNYLEQLVVLLPCTVVYAIYTADAIGVIGIITASLFLPLFAVALSSAVGYLIAMISRKIKRKTLVTTLISLAFLAAFFLGYNFLLSNMDSFMDGTQTEIAVFPESAPIIYYLGSAALLNPVNICTLIFGSLFVSTVAFFVISKSYIKITTDTGVAKRAVYKGEIVKRKSTLATLVNKEIKRFFSSTTYIMNGALGVVFTVVIAIIAVFNKSKRGEISLGLASELGGSSDFLFPLIICVLVLLSSTNMQSASALSLEGKNLWCVKSMPVSDREVLLSKMITQLVVTVPPALVAAVLFIIASSASVEYWAFYILTPIAANILFALLGIIMNVAFPKFDYENEVQPIKQSMAVFLTMMTQFVVSIMVITLNSLLAFIGLGIVAALLTFGIFVGFDVLFYFVLVGPCVRKYAALEP